MPLTNGFMEHQKPEKNWILKKRRGIKLVETVIHQKFLKEKFLTRATVTFLHYYITTLQRSYRPSAEHQVLNPTAFVDRRLFKNVEKFDNVAGDGLKAGKQSSVY